MGLASKLQAAQGAMNAMGPMTGQGYAGAAPSAPPYPPAGAGPYAATPGPYPPAQGPSPYPPLAGPYPQATPAGPYPPATGGSSPAPGPYPSPYPAPQQQQGMTPSPYPAQPQQPAPYPGQPGAPQQQQPGMQGPPGGYPAAQVPPQQQQFGAAPMGTAAAPGGGGSSGMVAAIQAKLEQIINANQLGSFYPPGSASSLAAKLDGRVNFRELGSRWSMPVELALDLAALALYDVVLVADDSGSMAFDENGERIDDLKMIAQKVSEVATLLDDDGILVRFMNSDAQGNSIRSPGDVSALLSRVQYSGLTPLATSLRDKVLGPIVFSLAGSGQLAKPVLVITITDGEPTDNPKDLVAQVISETRNRLAPRYGPKAVAFEFAQVGKDQRAQAFLAGLDTHPVVGGSIDCTSYYELESAEYQRRGINLSPSMWLVKMMVGAIDLSHDKGDERWPDAAYYAI